MALADAELGLKIDGIPGDSGTLGFEGGFNLSSYSFGLTVPLSPASTGSMQQAGRLKAEFTVKGEFDSALPQIFHKISLDQKISSIRLRALSPAVGSSLPVVQYRFSDVIIGSLIDTAAYGADELSFSFERVKVSARGHNGSPQPDGTSFDYDFARRRPGSLGPGEIDLVTTADIQGTPATTNPAPDLYQDARRKSQKPKKKYN